MRLSTIAFLLIIGCVGCQTLHPCKEGQDAGRPSEASPTSTSTGPAPKVEVLTPETITVKAPRTTVVVEQPSPPHGVPPQMMGPGYGGIPQQMVPTTMMPMTSIGAVPSFGNTEVREKNSVGLMFTSINIPIPWLRLKVIPEGAEVTTRSQIPPANNFGGIPMQAFAPQIPMAPMQHFGGAMGGQMIYTGTQMVPMQGMQAIQVPAGNIPAQATANGFGGVPGGDSPADTVEKLKAKLKECEDLQNKLKSLQPTK